MLAGNSLKMYVGVGFEVSSTLVPDRVLPRLNILLFPYIETHEPPRAISYPALSNGINYATTSAMTPYSRSNSIVVPATPKNSLVNSHHSNFPPLGYDQHSAMIPVSAAQYSRMQPDKLGGMYVNPGIGMENPVRKSNALPSICPPNHGAVQPYMNGLGIAIYALKK